MYWCTLRNYSLTHYGEPFYKRLPKNGWTDQFAVWVVDSGGPKEAQVQPYSPSGANVPSQEVHSQSSVCGGDAALCQITLTTCYGRHGRPFYFRPVVSFLCFSSPILSCRRLDGHMCMCKHAQLYRSASAAGWLDSQPRATRRFPRSPTTLRS